MDTKTIPQFTIQWHFSLWREGKPLFNAFRKCLFWRDRMSRNLVFFVLILILCTFNPGCPERPGCSASALWISSANTPWCSTCPWVSSCPPPRTSPPLRTGGLSRRPCPNTTPSTSGSGSSTWSSPATSWSIRTTSWSWNPTDPGTESSPPQKCSKQLRPNNN